MSSFLPSTLPLLLGIAEAESTWRNARTRLVIVSPTPIPYASQPEIVLHLEHPAETVEFGAEVWSDYESSSTEHSFVYGASEYVERLESSSVYPDGEAYKLTMPPVIDGIWEFSARTNYGVVDMLRFRVRTPENSKLIHEPPP